MTKKKEIQKLEKEIGRLLSHIRYMNRELFQYKLAEAERSMTKEKHPPVSMRIARMLEMALCAEYGKELEDRIELTFVPKQFAKLQNDYEIDQVLSEDGTLTVALVKKGVKE